MLLSGVFGTTPVIGASGAVYGIMVAFALLYPNAPIMLFLLPPLPAKYVIAGLIAIDVILIGDKTGEGVFGVSFKIKGAPKNLKTSVNPIKTLTPRFITRTLEKIKKD